MAYTKRDWDNTSNEVTKEDFKRIENGIETNDKQINVLNESSYGGNLVRYKNVNPKDWTKEGEFLVDTEGSINLPVNTFGKMKVKVYNEGNIFIEYITHSGIPQIYHLVKVNGTWGTWTQVATVEVLNNALAINNLTQV